MLSKRPPSWQHQTSTPGGAAGRAGRGYSSPVATYKLVYGDDENVLTETFENIDEVEREDGWVVLFRGSDAILRVQEAHIQSMELLS